jgi:hypothetical protein
LVYNISYLGNPTKVIRGTIHTKKIKAFLCPILLYSQHVSVVLDAMFEKLTSEILYRAEHLPPSIRDCSALLQNPRINVTGDNAVPGGVGLVSIIE